MAAAPAALQRPQRAEPFFYGGQAVIEGVLMRGPREWVCAARRRDGSIEIIGAPLTSKLYTSRFWRLPFLRGIQGLVEMMHLGTSAIQWSARLQASDQGIELSGGAMRGSLVGSVVVALSVFVGLPLVLAGVLHRGSTGLVFGLIEGVARAVILVAYLAAIAALPPIRRLFEYHGAEHKTINCFEAGTPLTVAGVRASSRLHPRCGTGFIVVVAFVGFIVFVPLAVLPWPVLILSRLVLIPLVAAVAYEGIRLLTRVRTTPIGRVLLVPVLSTQRLTTREPDDSQIEVAIAALEGVLARGGAPSGALSLAS